MLSYSGLRARTVEELAEEMRARRIRYALYTWRKTPETPSDEYYHKKLKAYLSEAFRSGGPVPGFEHVATLDAPEGAPPRPGAGLPPRRGRRLSAASGRRAAQWPPGTGVSAGQRSPSSAVQRGS